MKSRELSIVSTLYNSSGHLEEFVRRMMQAAERLNLETEIILVNDGSPDDSLSKAIQLQQEFKNIKVIDLSRNFGHTAARLSGLRHATKAEIFLIDVDLEESPEWLNEFLRKKDETDADVVFGVQIKRKGGIFEQVSGFLFYRFINIGAGITIPNNPVTARLMNRKYVNSLLEFDECNPFLAGIWALTGYEQVPIPVQKGHRGVTNYSFKHKFRIATRDLVSFSTFPLKAIFGFSIIFFVSGALGAGLLILDYLGNQNFPPGWLTIVLSIWIFTSIQIFFMGILGTYLAQILLQVKNRPRSIVKGIYEQPI